MNQHSLSSQDMHTLEKAHAHLKCVHPALKISPTPGAGITGLATLLPSHLPPPMAHSIFEGSETEGELHTESMPTQPTSSIDIDDVFPAPLHPLPSESELGPTFSPKSLEGTSPPFRGIQSGQVLFADSTGM